MDNNTFLAAAIRLTIAELQTRLSELEGTQSSAPRSPGRPPNPPHQPKKRHMSAAARARISAAQKKRWAVTNQAKATPAPKKAKRAKAQGAPATESAAG